MLPREVVEAWALEGAVLEPVTIGLINRTFVARTPSRTLVIQRLHPVFGPEVNLDIAAVTAHAAARGVPTARLSPTGTGALWVTVGGDTWRALEHLEGRVFAAATGPAMARAAAALVGRFHAAMADLDHEFRFVRAGVHDTARHLARLAAVLGAETAHARYARIAPVGRAILEHAASLPPIGPHPGRVVHGDLKLTNVLFDEAGVAPRALLDLDTLGRGSIAVELGDMLRSWCGPAGEDDPDAALDEAVLEAALSGYGPAVGGLLTPEERGAIVAGTETVALELAARFCTDALEERYFGWDHERFASASEHHEIRARCQLSLARSVRARRAELSALAARALGSTSPR